MADISDLDSQKDSQTTDSTLESDSNALNPVDGSPRQRRRNQNPLYPLYPPLSNPFDAFLRQIKEIESLKKSVFQQLNQPSLWQTQMSRISELYKSPQMGLMTGSYGDILQRYQSITNYVPPSLLTRNLAAEAVLSANKTLQSPFVDFLEAIDRHQSMFRLLRSSLQESLMKSLTVAMQTAALSGVVAQPVPDPWKNVIRDMQMAMSSAPVVTQYENWRLKYGITSTAEMATVAVGRFVREAANSLGQAGVLTTESEDTLATEDGKLLTVENVDAITIATLEALAAVPADIRVVASASKEQLFGLSAAVTHDVTARTGLAIGGLALIVQLIAWLVPDPLSLSDSRDREQQLLNVQNEHIALQQEMLKEIRIDNAIRQLYYRVEEETVLRESPVSSSQSLQILTKGMIVLQRERLGRWIHVELTSQAPQTGWVFDGALKLEVSER